MGSSRSKIGCFGQARTTSTNSLTGSNTPMGQRMVHFSETPAGWKRSTYRRTDERSSMRTSLSPTQSGRSRRRGGRTHSQGWYSGRMDRGTRTGGGGILCGVEEGKEVGRKESPHGILPGSIRRGVRGPSCALWQWQRKGPSDTNSAGSVSSRMLRPRSRG